MTDHAVDRTRIRTWITRAVAAWSVALVVAVPSAAEGQVERVYHPMYLPAAHNWEFRAQFPSVDRLFSAFDYGHGILYETLWARPGAPVTLLEEEIYDELTKRILPNPPRMPMPEASFMPRYARLVPLAKEMFEWAHILHRQTYDALAAPGLSREERDRAMQELLEYYRSSDLAFTDVPKGMEIMDEQHFSKEFRETYPKFNGLIWAYHWLQIAVYEPLLAYDDPEDRQTAMNATLARFWQMLENPPEKLPSEMPMSPAVAPLFTERYPELAAIFDNLHMMHDVISDVLVSDEVPRAEKRAAIYRQADLFRDPDAMAVSREGWIRMALAHGLDAQGGAPIGWFPEAATVGAAAHEHEHGEPDPEPDAHEHGEPDPEPDAHEHGEPDDAHEHHHEHDHPDEHEHHHEAAHQDLMPEGAVRDAVASLHAALQAGDSARVLDLMDPEVLIYEQGRPETLEEYRSGHLAMDIAFAREVDREVLREEVVVGHGTALYLAETRSRGTFQDREIDASGVETVFLTETPEGWRIRHVHWSSH